MTNLAVFFFQICNLKNRQINQLELRNVLIVACMYKKGDSEDL